MLQPLQVTLFLLLSSAALAHAQSLNGMVVDVADGDTITVQTHQGQYRIRLSGIDAPEHDQPFGEASKHHLEQLVLNKTVRVESERSDAYQRLLGKVWVRPADCPSCPLTLDANLGMLTVGLAWWYRYYRDEQSPEDQGRYEFAEFEARAKRVGLWRDPDPTAPWDWPRGNPAPSHVPGDCDIKGNISDNGRIYHVYGQRHYGATRINPATGERWFCSEAEAEAAGWRRAKQ